MLKFYNDRTDARKIPYELKTFLSSKGIFTEDEEFIHFVGLTYFKSIPYIFLPRNSDINTIQKSSSIEKEKIARDLLTSIQVYQQSQKNSISDNDNGERVVGEKNLTLLISLLNDFNLNGLYKRRTNRKILNSGKINWKKTMHSFSAYPSDESPLYLEYEGTERRTEIDNKISKIHSGIILEISRDLGWLTYSDPSYYENTLKAIGQSELSIEHQLVEVQKELDTIYSERDIFLLKSIFKYLKNLINKENTDIVIGIKEFHSMWENILGTVLHDKININKRLAAPVYKISNNYILASSRGQKTDIVLKQGDTYIIIDAKYYRASNVHDAPSLSDIVKQFYYAKTLSLVEKEAIDIISVFIFPGERGNMQSIHMALKDTKINSIDMLDEHYSPILCMYQDPIKLINLYANGKKIHFMLSNILT